MCMLNQVYILFEEEKGKFIEDVTPFIKKYMPEH